MHTITYLFFSYLPCKCGKCQLNSLCASLAYSILDILKHLLLCKTTSCLVKIKQEHKNVRGFGKQLNHQM